jgi:chromate transporter
MTQAQFVDLFAISRAAPGPGALLATLVGWRAAGWVGAAVASLALFVPSSVLAYAMATLWRRFDGHPTARVIETALAPIAAGLLIAGALAVIRASSGSVVVWAIALVSLAVFVWRPRLNPLVVLACAGVAGALIGG